MTAGAADGLGPTAAAVPWQRLPDGTDPVLALLEDFPAPVWRSGPDGACTYVNRAWREFTGRTLAQELGSGWSQGVHPDDLAVCLAVFGSALAARVHVPLSYRLRDSAGAWRHVKGDHRPLVGADGRYDGYLGVLFDLTDLHTSQEQLSEQRQFLGAVLDNLSDALVACDAQGRLTLFNPAARRLHGMPPEPVAADSWAEHYSLFLADGETPMPPDEVPLLRALRGEVVRDLEMVVAPAGLPPRTLLASGRQVCGRDGVVRGALVAMHDVTALQAADRLRADQERAHQRQEAAEEGLRRLQQLNAAALAVNREHTVEGVLDALVRQATALTGARQATTSLEPAGPDGTQPADPTGPGRLTVPLLRRDGSGLGQVQLSDKVGPDGAEEDFDGADEAVVVQLAQIASLALEKAVAFAREHEVAVALQRSLLPQHLPVVRDLVTHVEYVPGRGEADLSVGGDFYDLFELADGRLALVLGDVVGHGLRSASLMGQVRSALRGLAVAHPDPATAVDALDRLVATLGDEAMATLAYGVLDLDRGLLELVLAGHPPPLLRDGNGVRELAAPPGLPLGAVPGGGYRARTFAVPDASVLLLYSDGLVETRTRSVGEGLRALTAVLAAAPDDPAGLAADVLARMTAGENEDDVALLVLQRRRGGA